MDFVRVIDLVGGFLSERGHSWALIGGLGLAAYGMDRVTYDVDIVVPGAVQDQLVVFVESRGFETLHRRRGFSNHLHPDQDWGRLDVMYLYGQTEASVFADLRSAAGVGGQPVPVASPEHLAAMKVRAIADDPARTFQDLADIRFLLRLPDVDRAAVRNYFSKHGLEKLYDDLERTL